MTDRLRQTIVRHFLSWREGRSARTTVRVEDGVAYVSCYGVLDRIIVTEGAEVVITAGPANPDVLKYEVTLEGG